MSFFVDSPWNRATTNTPGDLLEKIYDLAEQRHAIQRSYSYGYPIGLSQALSVHPNCTTKLAIRLSTSANERVKKYGFDALVRLERGTQ